MNVEDFVSNQNATQLNSFAWQHRVDAVLNKKSGSIKDLILAIKNLNYSQTKEFYFHIPSESDKAMFLKVEDLVFKRIFAS